jgi:CBS domain-containing protein
MSTKSATSSSASGAQPQDAWARPIRDFPGLVHLAPPLNYLDDPVSAVIEAFSRDRGAGAIFVVDADDHLLGCIPEQALDADLVTLVLPQRLWPALREMDTRDLLRAARAPKLKARDLMVGVRSVTPQTTLTDAVGQMVRARQPMAPLLDEHDRLLGYIRLFEVLAHFLRSS